MMHVHRAAGSAGIAAAILFVVLLATTFSYDPGAYNDPAKALAFAQQAKALRAVVGIVQFLSGAVLVIFFAGLGDRLGTTAPVGGMITRYFGIIAGAALSLAALMDWAGIGYLASFKDQAAAQQAWVALFAVGAGVYGLTGGFMGIAVLAAGATMAGQRVLSAGAGWLGVLGAVVILVGSLFQAVLPPETTGLFLFYIVAGVLFLIWFGWTGAVLRRG